MSAEHPKSGTAGIGAAGIDTARQAVVKQPGARRAKLTPAPNTDPSPETPIEREEGGVASAGPAVPGARGENDDRLRRDRPPHW